MKSVSIKLIPYCDFVSIKVKTQVWSPLGIRNYGNIKSVIKTEAKRVLNEIS